MLSSCQSLCSVMDLGGLNSKTSSCLHLSLSVYSLFKWWRKTYRFCTGDQGTHKFPPLICTTYWELPAQRSSPTADGTQEKLIQMRQWSMEITLTSEVRRCFTREQSVLVAKIFLFHTSAEQHLLSTSLLSWKTCNYKSKSHGTSLLENLSIEP